MEHEKLKRYIGILEALYSGELTERSANQVRVWLADDTDAELKERALEAIFERRVSMDTAPAQNAYLKLESLQKDLGMPVGNVSTLAVPRRRVLLKRFVQVAAAIVVILGTVLLIPRNTIKISSGNVAMNVVLPDNTEVTLEPKSKLSYPRDFLADRKVDLSGEALFKVTSADELGEPASEGFSVNAGVLTVNVRGTEFSVEYTPASETASVALYEGVVDVDIEGSTYNMRPGQQLSFTRNDEEPAFNEIPVAEMMDMGHAPQMVFDYAPLADILRAIEVNYGVPLATRDAELSDVRLSLNLEEETLESTLRYLSFLDNKYDYLLHNDSIVMVKKSDILAN